MDGNKQVARIPMADRRAVAHANPESRDKELIAAPGSRRILSQSFNSPLQLQTLAGLQRTLGNRKVAALVDSPRSPGSVQLKPLATATGPQVINRIPDWLTRLFARMRRRPAQPAVPPAQQQATPPAQQQAGGMEEVVEEPREVEPGPGQIDKSGVDAYLDEHVPRPAAHMLRPEHPTRPGERDKSRDKEVLKGWGNSEEAMRLKYRGERKQNLLAATRNGPAGPGNELDIDAQIESARQSPGKGACNIVAAEIAGFLGKCGIPVTPSHLKDGLGGNHSIIFFKAGAETIIFDATWQQFRGKLGIASHAKCDPTLVGTVEEIAELLETWSIPEPTREHTNFRRQYLSFIRTVSKVTEGRFTEPAQGKGKEEAHEDNE